MFILPVKKKETKEFIGGLGVYSIEGRINCGTSGEVLLVRSNDRKLYAAKVTAIEAQNEKYKQ